MYGQKKHHMKVSGDTGIDGELQSGGCRPLQASESNLDVGCLAQRAPREYDVVVV